MKEKCSELLASIKQAFSSKEGLIVVITIFTVTFFVTLIELVFTNNTNNSFVGIFALFAILSSLLFFNKKKLDK